MILVNEIESWVSNIQEDFWPDIIVWLKTSTISFCPLQSNPVIVDNRIESHEMLSGQYVSQTMVYVFPNSFNYMQPQQSQGTTSIPISLTPYCQQGQFLNRFPTLRRNEEQWTTVIVLKALAEKKTDYTQKNFSMILKNLHYSTKS